MLSVSPNCIVRSSLEEMLEALQRRDESERPRDVPPALPRRAVSRSRLPSAKRRLPVSFEAYENGKSSKFCVEKGEMRAKDEETELGDSFYVVAAPDEEEFAKLPPESAPNKIGALEGTLEVQKGMHGHHDRQHLRELEEVAVTLQSYVRGEITRKAYTKVKSGSSISEIKNLPREMLPLVVEELQNRVSMAEAALKLKENENASLREEVQQFKAQWSEFEAKMKSSEEMWQKQITSLQMALAAAEKSLVAERSTISRPAQICPGRNGVKELEPRKVVSFEKEAGGAIIIEVSDSHYATTPPIEKLRRLKRVIKAWTKDNKFRLRDSKTKIHSHSMGMVHSEADGRWKAWWGRNKSKRPSM
ncbi:myosin 2 [Perilla frutescens var. hirtella]|nr:myosin 2 [Perilla frutescens var. hirtella]